MSQSELTFADLTTIRVGGAPDEIVTVTTREDLITQAKKLLDTGADWMPLGGGSNTIMNDEGFPGTLLLVRTEGITDVSDESLGQDLVRINVEAGHDWDNLVATCVERGWLGLEALSGIPGAAGAAPIQNIGAYGAELSETLHSIELLEADTGEVRRVYTDELEFGYRDSALKRQDLNGLVVSIDLVLNRAVDASSALSVINHDQLARAVGLSVGDRVEASVIRDKVIELRRAKGMVLDEEDRDTWSSGSFFMNPIVSESFARSLPADVPKFVVNGVEPEPLVLPLDQIHLLAQMSTIEPVPRQVKLSAAWLIDNSGIGKGYRLPGSGAQTSTKHSLAITNRGGASAADVASLARYIISMVRSEFGVILAPEPNLYGLEL